MAEVMPGKTPHTQASSKGRCVEISTYSKHWPCYFPQHGPGRKHLREIRLTDWQERLVKRSSESLLRGLIHSDGCRIEARYVESGRERLRPRYVFSKLSEDIKAIFCDACDRLDIPWTRANYKDIAIARQAVVTRVDEFIGPKR